jgi:hypothetical protein
MKKKNEENEEIEEIENIIGNSKSSRVLLDIIESIPQRPQIVDIAGIQEITKYSRPTIYKYINILKKELEIVKLNDKSRSPSKKFYCFK